MKNTRGRGRHGGCHTTVHSRVEWLIGAEAITGRQINIWRNTNPSVKIKAHVDACHGGKVDENCNGCRELMKDL